MSPGRPRLVDVELSAKHDIQCFVSVEIGTADDTPPKAVSTKASGAAVAATAGAAEVADPSLSDVDRALTVTPMTRTTT